METIQSAIIMKTKILCLVPGLLMGIIAVSCNRTQQPEKVVSPSATCKMTTPIPEGIALPDQFDSRLGTLKFFDGFPDEATVEKLYDNLDFQRAVQAYLLGLPAASAVGMRKGLTGVGTPNTTIMTFETLYDSRT
jgi:hypothetical protein